MESDGLDGSRTVVVSGVPDLLPGHRMRDKLTVHFQSRRRSRGGDVEAVAYPTNMKGVAFVTFDQAADAETVVLKEQQMLADAAFPGEYDLTVFPFSTEVFFYVSCAHVDLSMFDGDQASLIQSLRSAHRSLRFQPLPRERKATVEGPFSAVRALREDLMSRARQLGATGPAASVRRGEFAPNPAVTPHHGSVGPSGGLSAPLHSVGEGQLTCDPNVRLDPPQNQPPAKPGTLDVREGRAGTTAGGPEDTCLWVDSYIFRYMDRFDKKYKRCLRGLRASVEEAGGSDLVRIRLAEVDPSEGPSRAQEAVVNLNALVEQWQPRLRVHEIRYNKEEHPKENVMLICVDVEMKYKHDDVLYMVEESKVMIVGPFSSSYLFYFTVKQKLESSKI